MNENNVELLAPAGNIEKAKAAIDFGANAIYLGAKKYSLRARASNFGQDEIKEIVEYAKQRNVKVYVAANIICHNGDMHDAKKYFQMLKECGVDSLIIADPFLIEVANGIGMEIHISTQQSITNSKAAQFWASHGATRVVTAREVTGQELQKMIKNYPDVEYEYFIHGAVCIAYSGRCTMSNHFSNRDSNRGGCAQSCRWMYNADGPYERFTMSAKDSSLHNEIWDLMKNGVKSFKIEGRMKSLHYVATVVSAYRKIINSIGDEMAVKESEKELLKAANRETDTNFYHSVPGHETQFYGEINDKQPMQDFIFITDGTYDDEMLEVTVKNNFKIGQSIELFGPQIKNSIDTVTEIRDSDMKSVVVANKPMSKMFIKIKTKIKGNAIGRKL